MTHVLIASYRGNVESFDISARFLAKNTAAPHKKLSFLHHPRQFARGCCHLLVARRSAPKKEALACVDLHTTSLATTKVCANTNVARYWKKLRRKIVVETRMTQ
ncbi:MAG: hypothetical protein ABI843_08915 [Dokdonella sp.]